MKHEVAQLYRCPYSGSSLELIVDESDGDEVISGTLVNVAGHPYEIRDGIPYFRDAAAEPMTESEKKQFDYYEATSGDYDAALDWLFKTFEENEDTIRSFIIEPLDLPNARNVVEIGAGTCRDSVRIAARMKAGSRLFLQDFSPSILQVGRDRMRTMQRFECEIEYFVGGSTHLPFADGANDCLYHFGAFNVFPDPGRSLAEMTRVVRVGGRVIFGDESLAPWLKNTEYGAILLDANPLYADEVPITVLPESARNVRVSWFLGNAFYAVTFDVGSGPPLLDIDQPIPGIRGGTLRSRRYGKLEAVSPEAKRMAEQEARRLGVSVHEWLDQAIRSAVQPESKSPVK